MAAAASQSMHAAVKWRVEGDVDVLQPDGGAAAEDAAAEQERRRPRYAYGVWRSSPLGPSAALRFIAPAGPRGDARPSARRARAPATSRRAARR
eukprot:3334405-Prymnesium_polylepis.1